MFRIRSFMLQPMEILTLDLPGVRKIASGKVREIFDLGEHLLLVATDRISAFDCILPNPIPDKGAVLTSISAFWFQRFDFVENHVVATEVRDFPAVLQPYEAQLARRAMVVKKAKPSGPQRRSSTIRTDGRALVSAVAKAIASGSLTSLARASANHSPNNWKGSVIVDRP